jgi:hypothetical protein
VSANPTSFTTRQVPYDLQEEHNLGTLTAGPAYDTVVAASTPPGSVSQYEPWVTPTYVCYATTALSQAEKALRESSGIKAPVQCWGCEGPHLWRDCPKKADEECLKRFTENLAKYTEQRHNCVNRFDPARYKKDGFPSKVASSYFNQLLDPELDGNVRRSILQLFLAECATSKGYFTRESQVKSEEDDEEISPQKDNTPYISFKTYHSIDDQLGDRMASGCVQQPVPVDFVVPARSSVLVTLSGSVINTSSLVVPAPSRSVVQALPNVNQTTWGQPYGTHYTDGTNNVLFKYSIDLCTRQPIDPYTGKTIDFNNVLPRQVIDAVHGNLGMVPCDGSLPPPYISMALMDSMAIDEGRLSSFADSPNCLNGEQYKARYTSYADCFQAPPNPKWNISKMSFTCWYGGIQTVELSEEDKDDSTWDASPNPKIFLSNADMPRIAYPIAQELPHIQLPIGRNGTGRLEGLLDTAGCSTLGHLPYFMELAKSHPDLVVDTHELQQFRYQWCRTGCSYRYSYHGDSSAFCYQWNPNKDQHWLSGKCAHYPSLWTALPDIGEDGHQIWYHDGFQSCF